MAQQQQLADRIDVAALPAFSIPGVADLQPPQSGYDIVITACANDPAAIGFDDGKRQHMPRRPALQGSLDIGGGAAGFRNRRYTQFPQPNGGGGPSQRLGLELGRESGRENEGEYV